MFDQPVYALTKEIQWWKPETFGKSSYFSLFGWLHIEKVLLIVHGEFFKGSGLNNNLSASDLSIIGAEVMVNVNHIKQARYYLQVCLSVWFMLS